MTRLPARFAVLALACSVVLFPVASSFAQDAAPAPTPAPAPAPDAAAPAPAPAPAPDAAAPAPAPAPAPDAAAPAPTPAPAPDAAAPAPAPAPAPDAAAPAPGAPAAPGGPAAPAAQPGAPGQVVVDEQLHNAVENFWHYAKIARYDLAQVEAQNILAKKDQPAAILLAFEQVAEEHKDAARLDEWLLRWQGTQQLKDTSSQIITLLNQGRSLRRADPYAIQRNVERLVNVGRGYELAVRELRDSGELAVPIMIDYLRDPAKAKYHDAVRNALRDLGRLGLNPLVAVTETKNQDLLIPVVSVLGEIGYSAAIPYLDRLAVSQQHTPAVRNAAAQAIARMGVNPQQINPSDLFYELGEKFYYDNADIQASKKDPNEPGNIWYWDEQKGLVRLQVPQGIFNEIMAMRAAEYSLKLGQSQGDALSLWLASNYKREAELPEGMKDPTRAANAPSAHFYGVDSGASYLNNALARGLRDRNSQVSLRVIKSLQEIIGRTNMFAGQQGFQGAPALIAAMSSPDRLVRFESAFAVAAALPQQQFAGQDRVVPLLAEAMSQTGVPSVLVVMPTTDRANATVNELKQAGYSAIGSTNAEQAVASSNQLPAVDVILISEELGPQQVDQLLALATQNAKLAGSAKVVVVKSGASPYTARAINEPLLSVTQAADPEGLKNSVEQARAKASALPIDQQSAATYALRAAELLKQIALTQTQAQNQVLNLGLAEQTVLAALNDPRPDVVKAAGQVLAYLNSTPAQAALLQTILAQNTADDVRVSLLKSASTNAKFFGNRLNGQQVQTLDQMIEGAQNQDVKNGAGEFRGALNLPADQAKTLVVKQSRV